MSAPSPRRGFTLIEVLVVIGVIGLLLALLLPALSGVRSQTRKTAESNRVRQLFNGWTMYANQYDDAAMPGFLPPDVQADWNVTYKFSNNMPIAPELAAPYTLRILPFLDWSHDVVHGYLEEADPNVIDEAAEVALLPAFGYNANYVGGWYEIQTVGSQDIARPRFSNAEDADGNPVSVVTRSASQLTAKTLLFATASPLTSDRAQYLNIQDDEPGFFNVVPPMLADEPMWTTGANDKIIISQTNAGITGELSDPLDVAGLVDRHGIPAGRYTGSVVYVKADGSVDADLPGAMMNMRLWIENADTQDFMHTP